CARGTNYDYSWFAYW
nr:immunoglobulin heavy chain junction region [Mus musculus]MBK4189454.1 immunoglobulin heavy chain junction region [Mus musculus]MBK4189455.1 immunoglobulin heavy chain junction region [Mus musculus]